MSVSTSTALLDLLKESEVLSEEQLLRAANLIGDESDTKASARRLVKASLLTRWQASQLLKGSTLLSLGKYVLLERLPWGSNHAVFLATHPMMDRKVALNVLDRSSSSRAEARESFITDARSIAALDHRHLIHVFDIDEAEGRCFLVMEYVEGRSLREVIKAQGPLPLEAAADIVRQIADGLAHAHQHELVHGGLRPTNVIVDDQGTVKIIDLGLSKFDDIAGKPSGEDEDSKILGIADCASPEQAAGQSPQPASDIYSLGCIAYCLLTGKAPFDKGTYQQRLARRQSDDAPDVRKLRKDTPPELAAIVAKMMAKTPDKRYASARDVVKDLEAWWSEYAQTLAATMPKPAPERNGAGAQAATGALAATGGRVASGAKSPPASAASTAPIAAAPPPKRLGKAAAPAAANSGGPAAPELPKIQTAQRAKRGKSAAAPVVKPSAAPQSTAVAAAAVAGVGTSDRKRETAEPKPQPKETDVQASRSRSVLPLIIGGVVGALFLMVAASGLTAFLLWPRGKDGPSDGTQVADAKNSDQPGEWKKPPSADGQGSSGSQSDGVDDSGGEKTDNAALPVPGDDGDADAAEPNGGGEVEPPDEGQPNNQGGGAEPDPPAEANPPPDKGPNKDPPDGGNKQPPKDKPKPAKKEDPFRSLAAAIDLPSPDDSGKSTTLGKIHLPAETACYIDLLAGDRVAPKEKDVLTLDRARNGLADREWELKLQPQGQEPTVIAKMSLEGEDLKFVWMPAAADREAAAYLRNCLFDLRTADFERFVALRKPQQVTSLSVRLDGKLLREKYKIEDAPRPENVFVEITGVGGAEKYEVTPKKKLTVEKDATSVRFGEGIDQRVAVEVVAVMQKDVLQLSLTPYVKAGNQTVPYNQRQLQAGAAQVLAGMQRLNALIAATKNIKDQKQRDKAKKQYEANLKTLEEQYGELEKLGSQLKKLSAANVYIKFRVYSGDGVNNVDLIRGDLAPEAPEAPEAAANANK